jgi:hypothetical protein
MTDFEQALKTAAEKSVLKIISEGQWVAPDYANRFKLPAEFMADVWTLVDANGLKRALAVRLEAELADRIVNHMAAEIATDIKQLLSVKERREELRAIARKYIDELAGRGQA